MKNNGFVEKLIASHHSRTEWRAVLDLDAQNLDPIATSCTTSTTFLQNLGNRCNDEFGLKKEDEPPFLIHGIHH